MAIASTVSEGATTAGTGTTLNKNNFAIKFEEFLKLLTIQLQNQDPTAPMDSEKFTQQLTQFSAVEQAIRTNSRLDTLIDISRANQIVSAASYVGQQVELRTDRIYLPAVGDAAIAYSLPRSAADVRLKVLGEDGEVLAETSLPTDAGFHEARWDGLNEAGVRLPSGDYRVEIEARDERGQPIAVGLRSLGVVDAVEFDDNGLLLSIGGVLRPIESVAAIRRAAG
ncbi:MAG TPA: hypothetical protein ENJ38_00025 [Rhodospirillales bacterium]|nr:hypothetical protein [Rhodospirillales bacterium]